MTEMGVGCYYMPFHWPFLHVCGLGLLFSAADLKLLLPVGVLCTLLYFFPRSVLTLVGLLVLWMLWPILAAARRELKTLIDKPYGVATSDEDKAAAKKAEEPITDEGRRLYSKYDLESAVDPPTKLWQALGELGLKRTVPEAAALLAEYDGSGKGRLGADEFLQLVACEVALAGTSRA